MTEDGMRPGQDGSAARTGREPGHRRRTAPTVEDMASPPHSSIPPRRASGPRVRPARVVALAGAVVLTATVAVASLVLPERDASASPTGTGAAVSAAVAPTVSAATAAPSTP